MSMSYEDHRKLFEELKAIARKYNVQIITAQQQPRPPGYHVSWPPPQIVFIDHLSLLR